MKEVYVKDRLNGILVKLPMVFFTELEQIISQFVWKHTSLKSQSNLFILFSFFLSFFLSFSFYCKVMSQSNLEKEEWNWRNQPA